MRSFLLAMLVAQIAIHANAQEGPEKWISVPRPNVQDIPHPDGTKRVNIVNVFMDQFLLETPPMCKFTAAQARKILDPIQTIHADYIRMNQELLDRQPATKEEAKLRMDQQSDLFLAMGQLHGIFQHIAGQRLAE